MVRLFDVVRAAVLEVRSVAQLGKRMSSVRSLSRFRAYLPEGMIWLWEVTWDWLPPGVLVR